MPTEGFLIQMNYLVNLAKCQYQFLFYVNLKYTDYAPANTVSSLSVTSDIASIEKYSMDFNVDLSIKSLFIGAGFHLCTN